jgi:hypothetical protein
VQDLNIALNVLSLAVSGLCLALTYLVLEKARRLHEDAKIVKRKVEELSNQD